MNFSCPICKMALTLSTGCAKCENNHSFDVAKQGYLHLLMSNKMNSKLPGDTPEMVRARRSFLEKGHYDIFVNELSKIVDTLLDKSVGNIILDAGCGEGYYTSKLTGKNREVFGIDISKSAVKLAAAKYKEINFAVASLFDIPFEKNSVNCLVNVFAPIVEAEFLSVIKKGGYMIIAVPGQKHLWEMKEVLYDVPYENEKKHTEYQGFSFEERIEVKSEIELFDNESIFELFSMTPYYWKTTIEGTNRLKELNKLKTIIHFDFLVYKKS